VENVGFLPTSACERKSLRSDFGVNSAAVLGSARKTLRKDLRFPALVRVLEVWVRAPFL
jgi:hypothetical protein